MTQAILNTNEMSHDEWLNQRKQGLGGSDAASVAGVNRWRSPIVVYMEKTGEIKSGSSDSEAAYWGHVMEQTVAQEFTKRTGLKVRRRNALLQHPDHEWMIANVDRMVVGRNEGLECKTASEYLKSEWEAEEVPAAYLLQCQHYMAVTGADAWWIAVLVGGNKFIYKKIERDDELIDQLISIEKDFWENNVLAGNPPLPDGTQASTEFLNTLYKDAEPDAETELEDDADDYIKQFLAAKQEAKEAEQRKKEAENVLKQKLGEYEKGFAESHIVTWKQITSERFDSKKFKADYPDLHKQYAKESSYRRFGVKEAK